MLANAFSVTVENDGQRVFSDAKYVGVGGKFTVTPCSLLSSCPQAMPIRMSLIDNCNPDNKQEIVGSQWYFCPYGRARIIRLRIEVIPVNRNSEKQGMMAVGIQAFANETSRATWTTSSATPLLEEVKRLAMSSVGPANRPITLEYSPRPSDGLAFEPNQLDLGVIGVAIAFSDPNRTAWSKFSSNEVAISVRITGELELTEPIVGGLPVQWNPAGCNGLKEGKLVIREPQALGKFLWNDKINDSLPGIEVQCEGHSYFMKDVHEHTNGCVKAIDEIRSFDDWVMS